MRKDDKFLCKKTLNLNNGEIIFTCNKWYTIRSIPSDKSPIICYFYDDNGRECGFTKDKLEHYLEFDETFCTKKDLRKLKLEKINESR